jgi:hypothetical protein
MGCSIKRDRKVWRFSGFTEAHRYDMIIMLSGSQEPLFFASGGGGNSVDTYKQIIHYFTQKQLTKQKVCGIL